MVREKYKPSNLISLEWQTLNNKISETAQNSSILILYTELTRKIMAGMVTKQQLFAAINNSAETEQHLHWTRSNEKECQLDIVKEDVMSDIKAGRNKKSEEWSTLYQSGL